MIHRFSSVVPPAKRPLLKRPLVWVGLAGTLALLGGVILPEYRNSGIYHKGESARTYAVETSSVDSG
ncbi:MAG: hypothetical protein Fur0046_00050 [Cyanobacteria bacterium J069]